MKLLVLTIIAALPFSVAETNRPRTGMYSRLIRAKLAEPDHCEGHSIPVDLRAENFFADAACAYKCLDGKSGELEVELEWNPSKRADMFRGDGNLWAQMSQKLMLAGRKACLQATSRACGRLEKLTHFGYGGMRSGAWTMPETITCEPTQKLAFSPFDPSMIRSLHRQSHHKAPPPATFIPELVSIGRVARPRTPIGPCKNTIHVNACWGDCLCDPNELKGYCPNREDNSRWAQTLGTLSPGGKALLELCADPLVEELRTQKMQGYARDVLQYYCEDFAWRTIFTQKITGTTCSAYRGDVRCEAVLEALLAQ